MSFVRKTLGEEEFRKICQKHNLNKNDVEAVENVFNSWDENFWKNKIKCFDSIDLLLCRESRRDIIIAAIGEFTKEYINLKAAENRNN